MNFPKVLIVILVIVLIFVTSIMQTPAFAHKSGCHSWHSCPSDTGSYTCGDKGYCSQCPDNQYCKAGSSISITTNYSSSPSSTTPSSSSSTTPSSSSSTTPSSSSSTTPSSSYSPSQYTNPSTNQNTSPIVPSYTLSGTISVDHNIINLPNLEPLFVKVSGKINGQSRGNPVILTVTKPDKSTENLQTFTGQSGIFLTTIMISKDSQVGLYSITVTYQNSKIGSTSFTVKANQATVSAVQIPTGVKNNVKLLSTQGTCHTINGILPDPKCTPGATDQRVTQDNIHSTICVSGYTKTVRPSTYVTNPIKIERMKAYGYTGSLSNYELDHLIPLEIGGNPTSVKNLWPEPWYVNDGAKEKDKFENYLHTQVCSGKMSLSTAQSEIASNWITYWNSR